MPCPDIDVHFELVDAVVDEADDVMVDMIVNVIAIEYESSCAAKTVDYDLGPEIYVVRCVVLDVEHEIRGQRWQRSWGLCGTHRPVLLRLLLLVGSLDGKDARRSPLVVSSAGRSTVRTTWRQKRRESSLALSLIDVAENGEHADEENLMTYDDSGDVRGCFGCHYGPCCRRSCGKVALLFACDIVAGD